MTTLSLSHRLTLVGSAWVMAVLAACGGTIGAAAPGDSTIPPGPSTPQGNDPEPSNPGTDHPSPADAGTPPESVPDAGTPAAPAVRFIGRFDQTDPTGPRFAWSGSAIQARFEGTSVSVNLASSDQFAVFIDGVKKAVLKANAGQKKTYALASNLPAGPHEVLLWKRTEPDFGVSQFLGFDFGGGALLAPPPPAKHRLEVIGDSISAGYGDEGTDPCDFSPDTENHYITYEAITARNVEADLITVAWSGRGVFRNCCDNGTTMPTYYDRILPDQATSAWDFSWVPEAVVINLGTNDFSPGVPDQTGFTNAYLALVAKVRKHAPNALILCTIGPMMNGSHLSSIRGYLSQMVSGLHTKGDANVSLLEFNAQNGSLGYGCDTHPSAKQHEDMAQTLTSALHQALGW